MPRRKQDGEATAARAGAEDSVSDELLNITALMQAIPQTPHELRAERRTRKQDFAYFEAHPHRLSYVRRYRHGELAASIVATQSGGHPTHVAVGFVCPGERVRVYIYPGHNHQLACSNAEAMADQYRAQLGMKARA